MEIDKLAKSFLLSDSKDVVKNIIAKKVKNNITQDCLSTKRKTTVVISDVLKEVYDQYGLDLFFDDVVYDGEELTFIVRKNTIYYDDSVDEYHMEEEDWNYLKISLYI